MIYVALQQNYSEYSSFFAKILYNYSPNIAIAIGNKISSKKNGEYPPIILLDKSIASDIIC